MKNLFLPFVVVLMGCASRIETVIVDPKSLQATGRGIEGVIYYEPRLVKVRYELTQLVDKDKGLIGTREKGTCTPVLQKEEIVTLPDYENPKAVLHKPSWFSSAEFGVTLNNGMLASVTTKSTPQTAEILEQVSGAKEVGIWTMPAKACNSGPAITHHEPFRL